MTTESTLQSIQPFKHMYTLHLCAAEGSILGSVSCPRKLRQALSRETDLHQYDVHPSLTNTKAMSAKLTQSTTL